MGEEAARVGCAAKKKRPRFFKVFFSGLCSKQLEISPAFRTHLRRVPPASTCLLRGPSGRAWRVDMVKNGKGRAFFREGWEEFAGAHSLQTGEFLVFEYEGRMRFNVMVFDTSLCEKWGAAAASAPSPSRRRRRRRRVRKPKPQPASGDPSKARSAADDDDDATAAAAAPPAREGGDGGTPAEGCVAVQKIPAKKRCTNVGVWVSQRRPVTEDEVSRAKEAASSFRSANPTLLLVMRKYDVYFGHMRRVPLWFSRQHLSDNRKMTLRDPAERAWTVNYVSCNGRHFFSGGWRKFALGNFLEEDDACVFELTGPGEFRVHVFRVVEEVAPLTRKVGF